MKAIKIWGKYLVTGKIEEIDEADSRDDAAYLVREYAMAYGKDWKVWSGKKSRDFDVEEDA